MTLTETQTRETTDQVLDEAMWEAARPWEEKWESLKVNESRMTEQELDDEDRQARFWRRRPDGFAVNEQEHIIYVLEFKRVSDAGQEYVTETRELLGANWFLTLEISVEKYFWLRVMRYTITQSITQIMFLKCNKTGCFLFSTSSVSRNEAMYSECADSGTAMTRAVATVNAPSCVCEASTSSSFIS
jgi:hypothetical protein